MSRRDKLRLRDIVASIETIRSHLDQGTFDRKTSDAVLYNLVVIGEAAAQLGEATRSQAPQIPWTSIVGLRNLITHQYFRVDLDVIQEIVSESLDQLGAAARQLLDA